MEKLIGRKFEISELMRCYHSPRSEFAIIYGRRRVGKTFLINKTFGSCFSFVFTGSHKAPKARQLELFSKSIQKFGKIPYPIVFKDWYHAFDALETMLEASEQVGKKVLFFDEMSWIDSVNSEFVNALEDFWNTWVSGRDDILLIASGSATSWMINNLVDNQGGLHNRITLSLSIRPFTLAECEEYLRAHDCTWDRYTITQCYMYLGGIPFYYSLLDYKKDLPTNIDRLFFKPKSILMNEFNDLYNVLFSGADKYIEIVRLLSLQREGMTRKQLAAELGINGGSLTRRLENLENCDFIVSFSQFGNKKKGSIIRLTDFFTFFYLKFIEGTQKHTSDYWINMMRTPRVLAWQGLTFELVGLMHIEQIKHSLGIGGVVTQTSSWRSQQSHAQIDLVIDRADRCIHLCEMKFSTTPFIITKDYEMHIRERMAIFREETRTSKTLLSTFVTTFGITPGIHSGVAQSEVTLDDLFVPSKS